MAGNQNEMSFWGHLDALRSVLFKIAIVMVVLCVAAFCVMPWFFDHVILAPCSGDFATYKFFDLISGAGILPPELSADSDFKVNLVSMQLTTQFFIHMSASCWLAFVVGFPIIIYLLWTFVEPALYEKEKRGIHRAFLFGNLMFFLGVLVGYFVVLPLAVRFLSQYTLSSQISGMVSLESYMDNFFTMILLMGIVFELPLLSWMLGKMGLLKRTFFKRFRRHAIVALLILAGLITPTGDPFTLFAVFIPVYALWEFSAALVPKKTQDDEDDDEQPEEDEADKAITDKSETDKASL